MAVPVKLSGNTYVIEKHKPRENETTVVEIDKPKRNVLISQCENTTVEVKGKCTKITIEGSNKCNLACEDVIASVEVVNCKKTRIESAGNLPQAQFDKCSGLELFLMSQDSQKVVIYTALGTQIDVFTPGETDNDPDRKQPIPEQFESRLDSNGKLQTAPVTHVGI